MKTLSKNKIMAHKAKARPDCRHSKRLCFVEPDLHSTAAQSPQVGNMREKDPNRVARERACVR